GPAGPAPDAAATDHVAEPETDAPSADTSAPEVASGAQQEHEQEQPTIVVKDKRRIDPNGTAPRPPAAEPKPADVEATPEIDEMRNGLDELTRDLQRVTAEYANYRKRVDRDRMLVAEQATGAVLTSLLPVLDDMDRARNHGDLVGPFASVAEQLSAALGKFGLTAFGDVGDPFDPTLHEAVAHTSSPDVTETACIEIMRRGYLLGDRLLRPALVAVADPE
ncbi:MAG TPA: nucleotide exchange factor GrpE, partial [Micromonosporaceae bacterium]